MVRCGTHYGSWLFLWLRPCQLRAVLGSGAALLGLSGLGILFGGSGGQQLWVLALHAALLLAGLLIAVGLIAFALWKLARAKPAAAADGAPPFEARPSAKRT